MHVFSLVYKFILIIYIFYLIINKFGNVKFYSSKILKQKTKAITRLPNAYDI